MQHTRLTTTRRWLSAVCALWPSCTRRSGRSLPELGQLSTHEPRRRTSRRRTHQSLPEHWTEVRRPLLALRRHSRPREATWRHLTAMLHLQRFILQRRSTAGRSRVTPKCQPKLTSPGGAQKLGKPSLHTHRTQVVVASLPPKRCRDRTTTSQLHEGERG